MNNFVKYKTHVLAKNSTAYELWLTYQKSHDRRDQQKLDQHLKLLDQQHQQLLERYA
jgi:cell division protein FtsI/penicillin-binding protein 2